MRRSTTIPDDLAGLLDAPDAALPDGGDLRPAAVIGLLLRDRPVRDDEDGVHDPRLLLIERAGTLRKHAGQVAFPGGKREPEDASLLETALREAHEEVGLPPAATIGAGRLHPVPTPTGYLIAPFVAWAPVGWTPRATSPEVHRLLMPRLSELADPAVHRITGRGVWRGFRYEMHEYDVHDPPVWGATARMIWELLGRLGLRED